MTEIIGRAYLVDCTPLVDTPYEVMPDLLVVRTGETEPLSDETTHESHDFALDLVKGEERIAPIVFYTILHGIHIASSCSASFSGFDLLSTGYLEATDAPHGLWGHYKKELTEEPLAFAALHHGVLYKRSAPEKYTRVANALRLYTNALRTRSPDFSLLGFVGSLESLFSVAPQELSFRLSLLIARFLGNSPAEQRQLFDRVRELYKTRSKLAHGDRISRSEQDAAIELVEFWTPEAEIVNRLCLRGILELGVADLFEDKKRHEALLTELLFSPDAQTALDAI